MSDVRALLAAERQSRRIVHPHLTYNKGGALICNVCNINVKAEQLWPGHLKSAGHRKNVSLKSRDVEAPVKSAKRKLETRDQSPDGERSFEVDSRKKPRPEEPAEDAVEQVVKAQEESSRVENPKAPVASADYSNSSLQPPSQNAIDEAEWAAFEKDIAQTAAPIYAAATIEAAPITAEELAAQQTPNTVSQREDEAEADKEDETRRMEEEFEVMEEMEDRIKRLRERREALKLQQPATSQLTAPEETSPADPEPDDESSDGDIDDWYG